MFSARGLDRTAAIIAVAVQFENGPVQIELGIAHHFSNTLVYPGIRQFFDGSTAVTNREYGRFAMLGMGASDKGV